MAAPKDKRDELLLLINSRHPIISMETSEELRVQELLSEIAAQLDVPLFTWSVTTGLVRRGSEQAMYDTEDPEKVLAAIAQMRGDGIFLLRDMARALAHDKVLRRLRELAASFREVRRSIVLSAPVLDLPRELEDDAVKFHLALPEAALLLKVTQTTIGECGANNSFKLTLNQEGIRRLAEALGGLTLDEARRTLAKCLLARNRCDEQTITAVLEAKRAALRQEGVLDYLQVEENFAGLAGLERLKEWLRKRQGAMTPEGKAFGLEPPKGVLITGVQGCGKSLCARCVAGEWGLQLARLDAGALYDKFIGESEKRLRKALEIAEQLAPLVLWLDEIEKGFAASGASAEVDAGLTQRILATLLTWLQDRQSGVFLVATSNNIAQLPPELLRKGRFDEIFFVDLPGSEARAELFRIHLRRRGRNHAEFDLFKLSDASEGFSGAEIEQAIASGLYTAFSMKQPLSTEVLLKELGATRPLSVARREDIERLRAWAADRAVPAN
jgi:SpoVK/Ycf46/Vps4 family AAA+-type ATPase